MTAIRVSRVETPGLVNQRGSVTSDSGLEGATRLHSDFSSASSMPQTVAVLTGMIDMIGGPISHPKFQAVAWARAVAACSRDDDARIDSAAMKAELDATPRRASASSISRPAAQAAATRIGTPVRIRFSV